MTNTAVCMMCDSMNIFRVNFEKNLPTTNTSRHSSGSTALKKTANTPLESARSFLIGCQVSNLSNTNSLSAKLRDNVPHFVMEKSVLRVREAARGKN